jgi:hypothetical protein
MKRIEQRVNDREDAKKNIGKKKKNASKPRNNKRSP